MAAHDKQMLVTGASLSPAPDAHFFNIAPKRLGEGFPSYRKQARYEQRQPTVGGELVDRNGVVGRQGVARHIPADHSLHQVKINGWSLYVAIC